MTERPRRLVLTGGGTAGHVLPHFALVDDPDAPLAAAIRDGAVKVTYLGSHAGMERDLVASSQPGWDYVAIATGKLRRYLSLQNLVDPFRVLAGLGQAWSALGRLRADAVFSKGGFVGAPVVWAAALRGIPVVVHESDLSPALATRLTARFARHVLVAFDETVNAFSPSVRPLVRVTGVPIRPSLFRASRAEALSWLGFDGSRPVLLVFGGSLGAKRLNETLAAALPALLERVQILHVTGKGKSGAAGAAPGYRQFEYLGPEMARAYAAADLALCRAGASSIFELAAGRVPMILVPLGLDQSRGDQIENARHFAERGWASVLDDATLTPEAVVTAVDEAVTALPARRESLAAAPGPDAAVRVGNLLLDLMTKRA